MNNSIPSKPSIIHNDMNLAVSKLGRALHQFLDVLVIQDIADHGDGFAAVLRDRLGGGCCLFCTKLVFLCHYNNI